MCKVQLIDSNCNFESLLNITKSNHLAIDTEFMREKTFFAKLCLVQVSDSKSIVCIDTIANLDLEKFWKLAEMKTWIIHSARQDLEVIFQATNILPKNLFDTQIAAGILGLSPQIGYAKLVEIFFQITLKKDQTRANWEKRPMSPEMIEYAADDVKYLPDLHRLLSEKLKQLERLEWVIEDSNYMINKNFFQPSLASALTKIKSVQYLAGKDKKAAHLLVQWRENLAIKKNLPRKWIISDKDLLAIATSNIKNIDDLCKVENLPNSLIERSSHEILALLNKASVENSEYLAKPRFNEQQKRTLNLLSNIIKKKSAELNITPEVLASKKELTALINGNCNGRVMRGWRKKIIGDELTTLID